MERITRIEGKKPVIYVAPHGAPCDDVNTSIIAKTLAEVTKGYAVINNGWEKANIIDYKKEKANCNDIDHCHQDVIKEEFLNPILRFKNKILKTWHRVLVVYIHGASNEVRKKAGKRDLNYIIGWGNGTPPSYTCQRWVKNFLIYHLSVADNCSVAEGKSGGNYAAWSYKNMAQLFRKRYEDENVDSVQVEVVNEIRNTPAKAKVTGQVMGMCFKDLLENDSWEMPRSYQFLKV